MKSTAYWALVSAAIYSLAFWGIDVIRCVSSASGCERRGDATAVVLVIFGFVVVIGIALSGYFVLLGKLLKKQLFESGIARSMFVLISAFMYSLGLGLIFLELLGNRSSFWMNAFVASVAFSACAVLLARLERQQPKK